MTCLFRRLPELKSILIQNIELASGSVSGWFDYDETKSGLANLYRNGKLIVSGYDIESAVRSPSGEGTVLIVDGPGQLHAAFATSKDDMTPVESCILSLASMIHGLAPAAVAYCFEGTSKQCVRKEKFPAYKSGRPEKSPQLKYQMVILRQVFEDCGIQCFSVDGYEADDCLASLAMNCLGSHGRVVVGSRDKDMRQLTTCGIECRIPSSKMTQLHIKPEIDHCHFVDYMAMVGDTIDGIPGIAGIGEKRAAELIKAHGTLEEIFVWAQSDDSKLAATIRNGIDSARLSRELFSLYVNLPIFLEPFNSGDVVAACSSYQIRKWVSRKLEKAINESGQPYVDREEMHSTEYDD